MSVALKLVGFAGLLALVFAGSMVVGGASGVDADVESNESENMAGHSPAPSKDASHVRGLAVTDDEYRIVPASVKFQPGRRDQLDFRIVDSAGNVVREFDDSHTRLMHVIVVRRDLTEFQHLHPRLDGKGNWSASLVLDEPGVYRMYADFVVGSEPHTLAADVTAPGASDFVELPDPTGSARVGDLRVELDTGDLRAGAESELAFTVTRDGQTVETEPYLGASGHLVALREGDLAFLHVHADGDELAFMSEFPSPGSYRLFLQFDVGGRLYTAPFTVEVER